ncbi:hypothetical protein K1T71_006217 [Dendrolimus kikuchii]|uniref:Uncharacterized protein n=1 Tax=Dendrolimus kikuchii TaxID=765133 RepID=A0ACC1D369_9NEOP|nr:hypothetical protein K1T71_006217 [Dendrolimus kikuchii]
MIVKCCTKIGLPNVRNLLDMIESAHQECGHGGRDLTIKGLNKKGLVIKPLLFKEIHARGQVNLIDIQTCPDRDFKYIFNYQDYLTKFMILRPLHTKTAQEVAHIFLDIFCTLGAPSVLQSDNRRKFVNRVVEELKLMWPELSTIHGKPRYSQSQESIEYANQDVQKILFAWMDDNKTNRCSEGLRFCQLQ